MENNRHEKDIFECGFDSFELDDDFLTRLDFDLKKNNANGKTFVSKDKPVDTFKEEKASKKAEHNDCFIDDSNDSDFFDFHIKKKKQSLKVDRDGEKKGSNECSSGFISCLSPILGGKASGSTNNRMNLSCSTPERQNYESNSKEKVKPAEDSVKNSDFAYLESDFFDDWDTDESKKNDKEREKVTLSQALKLIEEAESKMESVQESLNESIDLLTGNFVSGSVRMLFEESFDLLKSTEKTNVDQENSEKDLILGSVNRKPPAAQKLSFESQKINDKESYNEKIKDFCFNSLDDFDFSTQHLLKKSKQVPKFNMDNTSIVTGSDSDVKDSDLNESSDFNTMVNKKRKPHIVIESDTTEDSPSPKFLRQNISKKPKSSRRNVGRKFIDLEAEISDSVEVSSDEAEEDGEFDESFVDEASYLTQNCEANMTAKYLESVKSVKRLDTFKIPATKAYNRLNIYSQIPDDSNNDYEINSFCVKDVDEEEEESKADLSDLEIAEKILEMDRKKRKKKRVQKLRKINAV